jgi:hypothetical protein
MTSYVNPVENGHQPQPANYENRLNKVIQPVSHPLLSNYSRASTNMTSMAGFSWSDTFKAAFSSCLPFLSWSSSNNNTTSSTPSNDVHVYTSNGAHRIARARPDELQGLLADVTDTDTDAETHSLHSNLDTRQQRHGRSRKSKRRSEKSKRITFFGWNLFGRPAIQLPPDEDDDDHSTDPASTSDAPPRRTSGNRRSRDGNSSRTISSSTLDADAAPLDPSIIDELSPAQLQERALAAAAEEERRRRRRRKERKELKMAAQALAMSVEDDDTFEGFQGSGGGGGRKYPHMPSPFVKHPSKDVPGAETFGPFVGTAAATTKWQRQADTDGDADDDADLGGELYGRRSTTASGSNNSGSDSRSRASSSNNPSQQTHDQTAHLQPPSHPSQPSLTPASDSNARRTKNKRSRSSATSQSTSQSPSLPSPVLPPYTDPRVALVSPTSPKYEGVDPGFPSPGFGGFRSKNRDLGAFLARRGDD